MEIIKENLKAGDVTLKITDLNDLWYLQHLIDPGDLLTSKTTRKIKIGDTENAKVVKKTLTLTIEAETISFADTKTALRINGKVKQGTEEVPNESYHSITLDEGSICTLQKPHWPKYQQQRLEEAAAKQYQYLVCIFDREHVLYALTKTFGFEILAKGQGEVTKKGQDQQITKDFYQEICKAISTYHDRFEPEKIILASPAFYKETLARKITDKIVKEKLVLATCSSVTEQALQEVLLRPEVATALQDSRLKHDTERVQEVLAEIHKEGKAVYGWDAVHNAIMAGAVSCLLITDECIQRNREDGRFAEVDALLKQVEILQGKVHLISADQEPGKVVNGLGGVAALLRYKI